MPEAIGGVIIDHAEGLHHRIHCGWADESEAFLLEAFGKLF